MGYYININIIDFVTRINANLYLIGVDIMNAVSLDKKRDPAFTKEVERRSGQNITTCYQCGNCTAGCPAGIVYDRQVNQIMRGIQLGLKDEVLGSESIWYCLSCSMCSLRCPNQIDVAKVMETLRHMARQEGHVTVPKVEKFWFSFWIPSGPLAAPTK